MSEIRETQVIYGLGGYDPTRPNNNVIEKITAEISDKQLDAELEQRTCEQYLKLSPAIITQPQIWYLLRAFAKKLGYTIKSS